MPADTLTSAPPRHGMRQIQVELDRARDSGPLKTIVIPPCPALLQRLRDTMAEAEPDLTEVGRIVGSDVAMSAALIKMANSPAYLTGQPVQTIGQAMNRLGLERTATEMAAFLLQRSLPANSPHLQRFWERAAKRAGAMGLIARRLPGMSADLAHTYGLFCHVGTPVMLQSLKGYGSTMVEAAARIDRPYVATENANHRTDHAVVGALVARVWRLAPEVMAAIRRHHDLDMLGSEDAEPEVHTLVAAGLVAEHLMRRHEGLDPDADWLAHHADALRWLAIDEDELSIWEEELRALLDAA